MGHTETADTNRGKNFGVLKILVLISDRGEMSRPGVRSTAIYPRNLDQGPKSRTKDWLASFRSRPRIFLVHFFFIFSWFFHALFLVFFIPFFRQFFREKNRCLNRVFRPFFWRFFVQKTPFLPPPLPRELTFCRRNMHFFLLRQRPRKVRRRA